MSKRVLLVILHVESDVFGVHFVNVGLVVLSHVEIVVIRVLEWEMASALLRHLYVVVSCRWVRQSVIYWL